MNRPAKAAYRESTTSKALRAGSALRTVEVPSNLNGKRINNRALLGRLLEVLGSFADHATGANARPSLATLGKHVQASPRTVQRGLATLRRLGWIQVQTAHSWRLHRPTTWRIAADLLHQARDAARKLLAERSARWWAHLRLHGRSGRQVCHQPFPLQGKRENSGSGGPGSGGLLEVLAALQARNLAPSVS